MARTTWGATQFLDTLATPETRKSYRTGLKLYFTITTGTKLPARNYEPELDKISLTYLNKDQDYEKDYVKFYTEIKNKYAPKTVQLRLLPIRGLFEYNQITIPNAIIKRLNGRKAVEPISEEKIPRREEVKLILQHLPLHMKSFALFLLSGGFRSGEALSLTIDNLEQDHDLTRVNLKSSMTKTGRKRWSYITPEASQVYQLWAESRPQFIQTKASAFSSKTKREEYIERSRNKVFPFTYNTANKVWVNAVKKAGLLDRDSGTGRVTIRLHNLRKYFSTRGKWSDKDIPDFFLGHISGVRAVYNRYDQAEDEVREEYVKAIPSLTIEEYADTGKVEELESLLAENKQESSAMGQNVNYLVSENRELKDRVRGLEQESRLLKLEMDSNMRKLESQIDEVRRVVFLVRNDGTVHAEGDSKIVDEVFDDLEGVGVKVSSQVKRKLSEN